MGLLSKKRIYLDYASATPLSAAAAKAMRAAESLLGNPGAIHAEGATAQASLNVSRERIAHALACRAREVVFTSGLTESNNMAILGVAQALDRRGVDLAKTHWIVSSIEHPSVLECFAEVERSGGVVSHVEPNEKGMVRPETIAAALRTHTVFVSVGWANNEIGTVQPLSAIAQVIRAHEKKHKTVVLFHADAGQAPLYRASNVHTLGVDLFSLGSGKLYGPRGVGALYLGKRAALAPLALGGAQEAGRRAGTESVTLIAGFAEALAQAQKKREAESARMLTLRNDFATRIFAEIRGILVNGDLKHSLPHMLNISIPDINSEYFILALDRVGLALSTKAACSEQGGGRSHVVAALPGEEWRARNTLRISLGSDTTLEQVRRAAKQFVAVYKSLPRVL